MSIPDYQSIMLPLLEYCGDDAEHSIHDATEYITDKFKLTEEEKKEKIPSGQMSYIKNRTGWARTYLKKAGLLSSPSRGFIKITDRGREVLSNNPDKITNEFLKQFPEFIEFKTVAYKEYLNKEDEEKPVDVQTPEESLEFNYQKLRSQLADEIIDQIKSCSPDFFEKLVVELLVNMGYGGSLKDAGQATQRSNDGGIDGTIKEDKLGLDTIYIQAKRWENSVQRPEIQKFAGALQGVRARKGIFITTSSFSEGAKQYTNSIDSKIILIDGEQLAHYMIDYNVGVSTQSSYQIKRLDSDYFVEG